MKEHFLLSSDLIHLNHGSFGACPKTVFNNYHYWQEQLEQSPVDFITNTGLTALGNSKEHLAKYINCDTSDFFFTSNPTTAVNTIMRNLALNEGDEILSTNLEYGALDFTWEFYAKKNNVKYVRQAIDLPLKSKEHFLEMFWKGLTDKTKVIFISQITSATALIFPVKEIVIKAKTLGLITIIDGAHVPGHIPLDIKDLDPDYYTGAVHKWLLSPKGCSFLYVKKEFQKRLDPLIISWGFGRPETAQGSFLDYHEYNGTRDFSAFLTMEVLFQFRKDTKWEEELKVCKQKILNWYPKFCDLVGSEPICPVTEEFLGLMFMVPIKTTDALLLKQTLFKRFKIEIPVTDYLGNFGIRISILPYTSDEDILALYAAIKTLKEEGELIK